MCSSESKWRQRVQRFSSFLCLFTVTGRMDIDISLVEDCRRLAKQCKMDDLIEELENKCKQVYEFGKTVLLVHFHTANTCMCFSGEIPGRV